MERKKHKKILFFKIKQKTIGIDINNNLEDVCQKYEKEKVFIKNIFFNRTQLSSQIMEIYMENKIVVMVADSETSPGNLNSGNIEVALNLC